MRKHLLIGLLSISTTLLSGCAGGSLSLFEKQQAAPVFDSGSAAAAISPEPHKIALLLPLQGELAASSQAIKNGFLAAYYTERPQHPNLEIKVIDTSSSDIANVYSQTAASGIDVIVGPLTKPEVEKLNEMSSLPIPTVALNTADNYQNHVTNNLYQFGLLPQDEAQQVAVKMLAAGRRNVAIIAPEGAWGEKIVATFKDKFESNGGKVVTGMRYNSQNNFTTEVCQLVAEDPRQMCIKRKYQKGQSMPLAKQRRTDIDAFFVVATPQQGRQIIPLLKFYYAGDLPVYSISSIYSGHPQPGFDLDLNGVLFCEMPWVVQNPAALSSDLQAIRQQIMATWADSFANYPKFYALGVDAFNLALNLHNFLVAPQNGFSGATGKLYLDNYNHIYRQLDWTQIQDGVPVAHS